MESKATLAPEVVNEGTSMYAKVFEEDVEKNLSVIIEETVIQKIEYENEKNEISQYKSEEELRDTIEQQNKIIEEYLEKIQKYEKSNSELTLSQKDFEMKYDNLLREKENILKEKEVAVMRYAVNESTIIKHQMDKDRAEKKIRELLQECELLQRKLHSAAADKARIIQLLDNKTYELKTSQHELDRFKTDLNALETKLKWSQNSLKSEIELRREAENKYGSLNSQIQEYVNEAEKAKKDASELINNFYTSQENRAYVLDQQLKELEAKLIMVNHEHEDRDQLVKNLQTELQRLQKKQEETLQENNLLSMKVQNLETEKSEIDQKYRELKKCAEQQKEYASELTLKSSQVEQLKLQLNNEQQQLNAANEQINLLKARNADLLAEMECCRTHEAELLTFTHALTDKNVRLQSEFTALETKVQQLGCEQTILKRSLKESETKCGLLSAELLEVRKTLNEENDKLSEKLAEKVKSTSDLSQQIEDQKGETAVIKRKLELTIRELNKEITTLRKKMEQYETACQPSSSSSNSSLNTTELVDQVKVVQPERQLDRQALIEHIMKLQRASARKSEKLDFLEEHVNTLVAELQKKSKLLQSYILREQAGTLSSNTMDNNKANLAKYSGVMASMYGAKVVDDNLTLELSLDINRKLQAVLEDALLKNITLKENVDTLGGEIERLLKNKT